MTGPTELGLVGSAVGLEEAQLIALVKVRNFMPRLKNRIFVQITQKSGRDMFNSYIKNLMVLLCSFLLWTKIRYKKNVRLLLWIFLHLT